MKLQRSFSLRGLAFSGLFAVGFATQPLFAKKISKEDTLVKLSPGTVEQFQQLFEQGLGKNSSVEVLNEQWVHIQGKKLSDSQVEALSTWDSVEYVQPNYPLGLLEKYEIKDSLRQKALAKTLAKIKTNSEAGVFTKPKPKPDNLPIPKKPPQGLGTDPDLGKQWGMIDVGAKDSWQKLKGESDFIVAVLDTGIDYTHEDLLPNMWRNPGETGTDANGKDKESNGIDDDKNGYVDDIVGWDFSSDDNKPYDLAVDPMELLTGGGNPGHGTHCAGNVAAKGNNTLGISGVAPHVKIMGLRFISEKGAGTTADAIKAIKYAVDNGAKVLSNSWGSEGEDPENDVENKALQDAILYAQNKGTLFIAAAGNGHKGVGYDNDTDKLPAYPASYSFENIISVAALDVNNKLGSFSNWGAKTVHLGAPGVNVYSTTVENKYNDKVIDIGGFEVTWDGTSMATPHVAGAAALYWSAHPQKTWREVKDALLKSTKKIPALTNKTVTGGKLDVKTLMGE